MKAHWTVNREEFNLVDDGKQPKRYTPFSLMMAMYNVQDSVHSVSNCKSLSILRYVVHKSQLNAVATYP